MRDTPEAGGRDPVTSGDRTSIHSEDEFGRWLIAALEWERQHIETGESASSSQVGRSL